MDINFNGLSKFNFKNTGATYPTWEGSNERKWDAFGGYEKSDVSDVLSNEVEHFTNNESNDGRNNYQEYLYSIIVYYYKHEESGLKKLKKTNQVRLKNSKMEDIVELNYANTNEGDIKAKYTVTIMDMTTYLPNQPMLRMKCNVNNGEKMKDIEFINADPIDMTMREYNLELDPFKEIKFIFDLNKMI